MSCTDLCNALAASTFRLLRPVGLGCRPNLSTLPSTQLEAGGMVTEEECCRKSTRRQFAEALGREALSCYKIRIERSHDARWGTTLTRETVGVQCKGKAGVLGDSVAAVPYIL